MYIVRQVYTHEIAADGGEVWADGEHFFNIYFYFTSAARAYVCRTCTQNIVPRQ